MDFFPNLKDKPKTWFGFGDLDPIFNRRKFKEDETTGKVQVGRQSFFIKKDF